MSQFSDHTSNPIRFITTGTRSFKEILSSQPPYFWKPLVFEALSIISILWFGYAYRSYLLDTGGPLMVSLGCASFLLFSLFDLVFKKTFLRHAIMVFLATFSFLLFFIFEIDEFGSYHISPYMGFLMVAGLVFAAFFTWGRIKMRHDIENSLEIRFVRSGRSYYRKVVTGIILTLIILYFPLLEPNAIPISEKSFETFFSRTIKTFNVFSKFNIETTTTEELVKDVARVTLKSKKEFTSLSLIQQEEALNVVSQNFFNGLRQRTGIAVNQNEVAGKALYGLTTLTLSSWQTNLGFGFFVVWISILFLIMRSTATLFYLVVLYASWFFYQILIATNMIHITNEMRTKEVIEYS